MSFVTSAVSFDAFKIFFGFYDPPVRIPFHQQFFDYNHASIVFELASKNINYFARTGYKTKPCNFQGCYGIECNYAHHFSVLKAIRDVTQMYSIWKIVPVKRHSPSLDYALLPAPAPRRPVTWSPYFVEKCEPLHKERTEIEELVRCSIKGVTEEELLFLTSQLRFLDDD